MKINTWSSLLSFVVAFYIFSLNSFAQVTIGSGLVPEKGAILQLKQNDNEGANSTKGLGLPRVTLTTINAGIDDLYFKKQPAIGILYNWAAAINIDPDSGTTTNPTVNEGENGLVSTEIRQGICPQGWHIPTDIAWHNIESVMAKDPTTSSSNIATQWNDSWRTQKVIRPSGVENAHGHSMKSHCQPMAADPELTTTGKSFLPELGGFNVMLVGDLLDENIQLFGERVSFWSSSSSDAGAAWARAFWAVEAGVQRVDVNKARIYSVRCKQD